MKVKKARIVYVNDEQREGYNVEILVKENKYDFDEWGLDSFFPMVKRDGADADEEKNFIHFSLINKIAMLQRQGYTITFPHL